MDLPEQEIPELLRQSTFLSAKENTAFIRLFEDKEILIDFLNAVLRRSDEDVITEVEHMNRDLTVIYRKSDLGNKDALPVSDVLNYIFIKLPKLEGAKDVPEREREWMDFINNCDSRDEIPSTAQGAIRDAYERLRSRRPPRKF